MGVVKEAIADRVRHRGVPEVLVPLVGRELARDDRRPGLAAILQDLEQVAPVLVSQRPEAPVLEHEDVDAGELAEEADVGAVGMSEGELVEEPGHAAVERPISLAAGLLGKGAGEEALARPVAPVIRSCWCSCTQRQVASWRTTALSSSRRGGGADPPTPG